MRIAYIGILCSLFFSTLLSSQSRTEYDVEFSHICMIDSIAPDTINQIWLFTQANQPGAYRRFFTFDLSGSYTPTGTLISCNDYYLGDNVEGAGTAGTLPIWATSTTLGNSSLSETSGVLSSSLTGALKLPAGTDAQDPVWAAGMLRYNTTTSGFQRYNTAERYLPWANAASWANTHIPFSNGSQLTTNSNFKWTEGLNIGNISTANGSRSLALRSDDFFAEMYNAAGTSKIRLRATGRLEFVNVGTGEGVYGFGGNITSGAGGMYQSVAVNNSIRFLENSIVLGCVGANVIGTQALSQKGFFLTSPVSGASGSHDLTLQGFNAINSNEGFGSNLILRGGNARGSASASADIRIYNSHQGPVDDLGSFAGYPGKVSFFVYKDTAALVAAAPIRLMEYGGNHNFPHLRLYEIEPTTTGLRTLTMDGDTIRHRIENLGAISTSTDASGDIVVAHGMGVTPTSVQVTVTGTTPYIVTVHTIDATNFTVRFFDTSGVALNAVAVTATWHAKT